MNALQAKFERERKPNPSDWIIVASRGRYKLVQVRGKKQ